VIGAGGIGTLLLDRLCQYLNYYIPLVQTENADRPPDEDIPEDDLLYTITIVDGDSFEERNRERQSFFSFGNKAEVKAAELMHRYESLNILSIPQYVNERNIHEIILENDIVLLCVDNHDTRRLVASKVSTMENVILISGGNGYDSGDVLTNVRRNGINITPSITEYHPEIEEGDGQHPETLGCEELHSTEPQLIFANWLVACIIACRFYKICILGEIDNICENDLDTRTAIVVAKRFPATP
jgi:hypothetical protein